MGISLSFLTNLIIKNNLDIFNKAKSLIYINNNDIHKIVTYIFLLFF